MFRHDYSRHFTKLTAEEASRVNRSALVRGYIVKAYEERQAELQYVPPVVLDSSEMTHETFARDMSDEELEATTRVYATLESKGWSYQPEASQAEKFAECSCRSSSRCSTTLRRWVCTTIRFASWRKARLMLWAA